MPRVGRRKFPYTKKGREAAKKYSKSTGKPIMSYVKKKKAGY